MSVNMNENQNTDKLLQGIPQSIVPMVIESGARGERAYDIYSLLLKERIVFLGTPINAQIANLIVAQILFLAREDSEKDINLYINSPGGGGTPGGGGPEFHGGIFHEDDLELPVDVGDVGPLLLVLLLLPTPGGGGGGPPEDPPQLEGGGTPYPLPDDPQCPGGRGIPGGPRDGPPDDLSDGGG